MITREEVLREIPYFNREGDKRPRTKFSDLHRIVASQRLTETDLSLLRAEIVARKKALGFDDGLKGDYFQHGYSNDG